MIAIVFNSSLRNTLDGRIMIGCVYVWLCVVRKDGELDEFFFALHSLYMRYAIFRRWWSEVEWKVDDVYVARVVVVSM